MHITHCQGHCNSGEKGDWVHRALAWLPYKILKFDFFLVICIFLICMQYSNPNYFNKLRWLTSLHVCINALSLAQHSVHRNFDDCIGCLGTMLNSCVRDSGLGAVELESSVLNWTWHKIRNPKMSKQKWCCQKRRGSRVNRIKKKQLLTSFFFLKRAGEVCIWEDW